MIQNQTNESTVDINNEMITAETNEDYTTRYDILIYDGDYSETEVFGPSFKYEDVGVNELNSMGAIIPENIELLLKLKNIMKFQDCFYLNRFLQNSDKKMMASLRGSH